MDHATENTENREKVTLEKTYDPTQVEARIYERWEQSGAFTAKPDKNKRSFCIVMPPPNITGQLHMGHALDNTLQDILTRYHRLIGDDTLWLPGTDHASIATEMKIVAQMAEEGITKEALGREAFLERAWKWRDQYGGRIVQQLRKLGSSCDWSRERFTMDEGCSRAVREVFVRMYEEGLIYRGNRIINWCPDCKTAISDAEVEYEEQASYLWHIRYPGPDGNDIIVATTRPETMLGDTAVAVHPQDARYAALIGKEVFLPLRERYIPIVADEYVEQDFGSGAVKITPAHDPNDFEVALRHNLPIDRVMNDDGSMTEACGAYAGLPGLEARKRIVADLEAQGYLVKVEPYTHNVGQCYRCHHTVEPLVSEQWFLRMKPLAEPAIDAVRDGSVRFVPDRYAKIYYNWMENIRDWCISRQLWWGHRIPAWYCMDCGETIVRRETPDSCPKCASARLKQEEDVLDTWFSSALWPFSTLGWPDQTEDLERYYPTTVLVTAYDIIFFWVARMIFSGLHHMGEKPFADVLIHGIVRDAKGKKMSKSVGNGVDPLEIIEQYSADALRFSLAIGVSPGNDMRFSTEKVEAARNFTNKIWNAARFVLMNVESAEAIDTEALSLADRWILARTQRVCADVAAHLDEYDTGLAAQLLYDFIWSEYCDWYLELAKSALYGEDERAKRTTQAVLRSTLSDLLTMLHPFMPFLTEAIYEALPGAEGMLIHGTWPQKEWELGDVQPMEDAMEIIRAVRNLRSEMNVPPSRRTQLLLLASEGKAEGLRAAIPYFERLAYASHVQLLDSRDALPGKTVAAVSAAAEAHLPIGELVDVPKERARLNKELAQLEADLQRTESKLNNAGFLAKAPPAVIEQEKERSEGNRKLIESVRKRLEELEAL